MHFGYKLFYFGPIDSNFVRHWLDHFVPSANEGKVTPWNNEKVSGRAAHECVRISALTHDCDGCLMVKAARHH